MEDDASSNRQILLLLGEEIHKVVQVYTQRDLKDSIAALKREEREEEMIIEDEEEEDDNRG